MIDGTSGNDTLLGGLVEDDFLIRGGAGNDQLTGSNRANFSVYLGRFSDYTITTSAGVITVTDKFPNISAGTGRTVSDGIDTLRGMNLLRFADRDFFVTTAANKVTLPGADQVYRVSNNTWILGNTLATETFIVRPKASALIAVGTGDVVELSGAASSYTYKSVLNQLQISDGTYTTFLNVGGKFTLRTASGSTSVEYTGNILLGGTQTVGSANFSAVAAITDTSRVSSSQLLPSSVAPTVTTSQSTSTTPTLTGTAAVGEGQALTVTVNGVPYTTTLGLTLDNANSSWSLTIPEANKLTLGQSYEVRAELAPAPVASARSIAGTATADALTNTVGTPAVFNGAAGNDSVTGGSRADMVAFAGRFSEYTITTSAGVVTVTDKFPAGTTRSVSDGVDTLRGVNLLRFADRDFFVTTAANKVTLPGGDQTYRVNNSEWVLGNTTAVETFVVGPQTSSLIAVGTNDVVDLSRSINSYTYKAVLNQLQISDGTYTTFLNIGGKITLRTASGATSVSYNGNIVLGDAGNGTSQVVGAAGFDASRAISDVNNKSSNALLSLTDVSSNELILTNPELTSGVFNAANGFADSFILDINKFVGASINGFEPGDSIRFINLDSLTIDSIPTDFDPPRLDFALGPDAKILSFYSDISMLKFSPERVFINVEEFRLVYGANAVLFGDAQPDLAAPVLQSASTDSSGSKVILTYNETLSARLAPAGTFTVSVDGTTRTVTAVNANNASVELTLVAPITSGQIVNVSYAAPQSSGVITNAALQDMAGNDASALTNASVTNSVAGAPTDTTPPTFQSASTDSTGTKIVLTYSEPLGATTAAASAFNVMVNAMPRTVSTVAVVGSTVELTLSSAVTSGQMVSVTYTDPTPGNDANAVQDAAGNDAMGLSSTLVTNTVAGAPSDVTPPAFLSASTDSTGNKLVLTYSEPLSPATAAASAFAVMVNGTPRTVSAVTVVGSTVELTLPSGLATGQTVSVTYTDPTAGNDANAVQDAAGNDAMTLGSTGVTNMVIDTMPPTFFSASTDSTGTKVILTYNEPLAVATAAPSAFNVTVNGASSMVTAVVVSGSTVELTLASAVSSGQSVTVSYNDFSAANDANAVQDMAGNDAATFPSASVTNNVAVTPPPSTGSVFTVVSTHVQPFYPLSPSADKIKVVPTITSASGVTLGIQIDATVAPFNSMNLDVSFDGTVLQGNLEASQITGSWSLTDKGFALDAPYTISYGALTLGTPFNPATTPTLATSAFQWKQSQSGYRSADFSVDVFLENDQGVVLDTQQDFEFHYAPGGGTATGTAGNDTFRIIGGDVSVTGGAGSDRFVMESLFANLTITDFVSGTDKIDGGLLTYGTGYTSASSAPLSTPQSGVLSPWASQTLPTAAQMTAKDASLDNKHWFRYDPSNGQLDVFADRLPGVGAVDIVQLDILLANLPSSLTAADLLWSPYSTVVV